MHTPWRNQNAIASGIYCWWEINFMQVSFIIFIYLKKNTIFTSAVTFTGLYMSWHNILLSARYPGDVRVSPSKFHYLNIVSAIVQNVKQLAHSRAVYLKITSNREIPFWISHNNFLLALNISCLTTLIIL